LSDWSIRNGDCRDLLRELDENSVDAIVTDPPYELGFMGKKWDATGIAYSVELWREALRVLKPGGHMVAFGGSRTYHRIACAIEDAGFEIRDTLQWIYGQGFPKSLNVNKAIGGNACGCKDSSSVRSVRSNDEKMAVASEAHEGPDVFPAVQRETPSEGADSALAQGKGGLDGRIAPVVPREDERRKQPSMAGRRDRQKQARTVQGRSLRSLSDGVSVDGEGRRLRNGASARDGKANWSPVDEDRSGSSPESQPSGQSNRKPGTLAGQCDTQESGAWAPCPRCGLLVVPSGLGTALKPAYEPIILARKPLDGTVAANVQRWGTGAINIAACRVGSEARPVMVRTETVVGANAMSGASTGATSSGETTSLGRWPANVILSHSPDCTDGACVPGCAAAMLDKQAPACGEGSRKPRTPSRTKTPNETYNELGTKHDAFGHEDGRGGASRFFYCAKASTAERERGLEFKTIDSGELYALEHVTYPDSKWVNAVLNQALPADTAASAQKATVGSTIRCSDGSVWSMCWCGSPSTDLSRPDMTSIIETRISSTIDRKTWNSSPELHTNGRIAAAFGARALGGSPAGYVVEVSESTPRTGISRERVIRYTANAEAATSPESRLTSAPKRPDVRKGRRNTHCTVKSIALMRWLCRLITPPGGLVLDPFTGSGTTGCAARLEHFRFLGFEQDPAYVEIAFSRIAAHAPEEPEAEQPRQLDLLGGAK
jgi:DNA modification methylase